MAMDKAVDDSEREERPIDVLVDKSRAQGGTFGYLWIDLRRWLRDPMFSAGYVTRNEALVDSATDSDTLFWKLAWAIDRLPFWMVPRGFKMKQHRSLSMHSLLNPANGATLVGYAAGQDVAAGGRKTVFTADEFGAKDFIAGGKDESVMEALHDVTNHLRLVSARYADSGVFHEACEDPDHSGLHLILDWKDNPIHAKHSYVVRDGRPEARKAEDQGAVNDYHAENPDLRKRLERKGYKYEVVVRSPWYDMRCLRPTATPRLIASQLDRDPRGAVGKIFPSDLLDRVKRDKCKPPVWQGTPVFDSETLALNGLITRDDGPLKLWFRPGPDFSCPLGPFTLGCDIAVGSDGAYSSNSVVSGIDNRTGEQVVEYTVRGMPSIKFARNAVGLALWLRKALLGWEDSGMAGPFAKEIMEVRYYWNVYYRDVAEIGQKKKTKKSGWWNGKDEHKADLFEKMALGMETGAYTVRSVDLIRECGEYEWDKGKIVHQPTKNRGATEKAHGDRCFVKGTMVLTGRGERPIERLVPGDMVWTRDGLRPVQVCGKTGYESVFRVTLSSGRTLTGTGDHPVWTENRSWVQLQSLRECDRLLAYPHYPTVEVRPCQEKQFAEECTSQARLQRPLSLMAGCIIAIPMPSKSTEGGTSGGGASAVTAKRSHCTLPFGNIIMDLFQTASRSITRTVTSLITTLQTSNALRLHSMGRSTKPAAIFGNTEIQRGTRTHAGTAKTSIGHSENTAQSSVAKHVPVNTGTTTGLATKRECASSVPPSIPLTSMDQPGRVPQSAEPVYVRAIEKLKKPVKVYNLSIRETPEYFAEGVLVHNCIAAGVAYLIYSEEVKSAHLDTNEEVGQTVEYGSFLWCEQQEQTAKVDSDSPDFGLRDVVSR